MTGAFLVPTGAAGQMGVTPTVTSRDGTSDPRDPGAGFAALLGVEGNLAGDPGKGAPATPPGAAHPIPIHSSLDPTGALAISPRTGSSDETGEEADLVGAKARAAGKASTSDLPPGDAHSDDDRPRYALAAALAPAFIAPPTVPVVAVPAAGAAPANAKGGSPPSDARLLQRASRAPAVATEWSAARPAAPASSEADIAAQAAAGQKDPATVAAAPAPPSPATDESPGGGPPVSPAPAATAPPTLGSAALIGTAAPIPQGLAGAAAQRGAPRPAAGPTVRGANRESPAARAVDSSDDGLQAAPPASATSAGAAAPPADARAAQSSPGASAVASHDPASVQRGPRDVTSPGPGAGSVDGKDAGSKGSGVGLVGSNTKGGLDRSQESPQSPDSPASLAVAGSPTQAAHVPVDDGRAKTMTGVTNASPGPEASSAVASERLRDALASVANRAVLRNAASGHIDVPELGRIAVRAHTTAGGVDVDVTADRADARAVLRGHVSAMTDDLHQAAVPVARMTVDRGATTLGNSEGASPRDHGAAGQRSQRDDQPPADHDEDPSATDAGAAKRVRIVL